jgi:hypothetical protein
MVNGLIVRKLPRACLAGLRLLKNSSGSGSSEEVALLKELKPF